MKKVFLVLALAISITSCSLNDDDGQNINYQVVPITNVEQLPDTLEIGKNYDFLITSEESDCSIFSGFDNGKDNDSTYIFAAVNRISEVSNCDSATDTTSNELRFGLRQTTSRNYEAYIFKFVSDINASGDYEYITRTIPVENNN